MYDSHASFVFLKALNYSNGTYLRVSWKSEVSLQCIYMHKDAGWFLDWFWFHSTVKSNIPWRKQGDISILAINVCRFHILYNGISFCLTKYSKVHSFIYKLVKLPWIKKITNNHLSTRKKEVHFYNRQVYRLPWFVLWDLVILYPELWLYITIINH